MNRITVTVMKDGCERDFVFIGEYMRNLETENWHYYKRKDGELIHFRKAHMVCVKDEKVDV